MSRRTGKEGIYSRIIQDKRDKFKQEQIQLEIEEYMPVVSPTPEPEQHEEDEDSCMGSVPGISLGETIYLADVNEAIKHAWLYGEWDISDEVLTCPCGRYLKRCNPSRCKLGK